MPKTGIVQIRNCSFEVQGCDGKWYRMLLKASPEDECVVTSPDMQGLVTQGETIVEAMWMAKDALDFLIQSMAVGPEKLDQRKG